MLKIAGNRMSLPVSGSRKRRPANAADLQSKSVIVISCTSAQLWRYSEWAA